LKWCTEISSSNYVLINVEFFQKQEIISEYEMKLKMLETEMGHFKKCLTSNQELLQFSVSKNMQLADEVSNRKKLPKPDISL
jgi:hypothetical protein